MRFMIERDLAPLVVEAIGVELDLRRLFFAFFEKLLDE
jgi:hypothetical protein